MENNEVMNMCDIEVINTREDGTEVQKPDLTATVEAGLRKEIEELREELEKVKKSEMQCRNDYYDELATRSKYQNAFKCLVEELANHIKK